VGKERNVGLTHPQPVDKPVDNHTTVPNTRSVKPAKRD